MRRFPLFLTPAIVVILITACPLFNDPVPYDPSEGGWVLYAENDFSSSITTPEIPNLMTEGDASVTLDGGKLKYVGDSDPDDKMGLRTDYGFMRTDTDYKIYVEPIGELEPGRQHITFTGWHESVESSLSANLRAEEMELRVDGGSADDVIGEIPRREDMDTGRFAYELIIESGDVTLRVINLENSRVRTQIQGTLGSLEYIDGHDLGFRCGYVGTIYLDNYRIYTR